MKVHGERQVTSVPVRAAHLQRRDHVAGCDHVHVAHEQLDGSGLVDVNQLQHSEQPAAKAAAVSIQWLDPALVAVPGSTHPRPRGQ